MLPLFKLWDFTYRANNRSPFKYQASLRKSVEWIDRSKDLLCTCCPRIIKLQADLTFDNLNSFQAFARTEGISEWEQPVVSYFHPLYFINTFNVICLILHIIYSFTSLIHSTNIYKVLNMVGKGDVKWRPIPFLPINPETSRDEADESLTYSTERCVQLGTM